MWAFLTQSNLVWFEFFVPVERLVLRYFLIHVRTHLFMDLNTVKMSVLGASQTWNVRFKEWFIHRWHILGWIPVWKGEMSWFHKISTESTVSVQSTSIPEALQIGLPIRCTLVGCLWICQLCIRCVTLVAHIMCPALFCVILTQSIAIR